MKWRRIAAALLLAAALGAAFLLAGCGGNGKIKITVGMWPEPHLTDDVEMFNQWKAAFENDYPEYEIVGQPYTYAVDTFFSMAESNTVPTVFQTWFTEPQKLIKNRYVKDITDLLQRFGWYDKMDPDMRKALTADGRVYGVPRDGYALGLMLNTEMLGDLGVLRDVDGDGRPDLYDENGKALYPTTFDELYEVAQLVSENYLDVAGMVILSANQNGGWQFSNIAWNFGATLQKQDSDGKWVANLNDPAAVEALKWIQDMKHVADCLPASVSLPYSEWYNKIGGGQAAMCFAGSDAIAMPVTNLGMDMNDLAFVPMPAGPNGDRYALFGGTPYMFSSRATDKQVEGALRFLEYMGRSPEVSKVSVDAMVLGNATARKKGMPILPSIKPWVNEEYLAEAERIEQEYVNVDMRYFQDFYDTVGELRRNEEPNYCQDMYKLLDTAIQQVLSSATASPAALLTTANNSFQTQYLNKMK